MGEDRGKSVVMFAWSTRFSNKEKWHDLHTSLKLFISPTDTKASLFFVIVLNNP